MPEDSDNTASGNLASQPDLGSELGRRLNKAEVTLVALESRTLVVWRNLAKAIRGDSLGARRTAALGAFARWLLFGRPILLSAAAGVLVTCALAWQANVLLQHQNELLLEQIRLTNAEIEQTEIDRSTLVGFEMEKLLSTLSAKKYGCSWVHQNAFCLDLETASELAWFSQRVAPYRIYRNIPSPETPISAGLAPRDSGGNFERSARLISPERGRILLVLAKERLVNVIGGTLGASDSPWLTFEAAYAPFGAPLFGVDLHEANLRGPFLPGAQLEDAVLLDANFDNSTLFFADFRAAVLAGASFINSDLRRAAFEGGMIDGADFTLADLRGASFMDVNLDHIYLAFANLDGANLSRATISVEKLAESCFTANTWFPDAIKIEAATLKPPPACSEIWQSRETVWISFAEERPPHGALIYVRRLEMQDTERTYSYRVGRWIGPGLGGAANLTPPLSTATRRGEEWRLVLRGDVQNNHPLDKPL